MLKEQNVFFTYKIRFSQKREKTMLERFSGWTNNRFYLLLQENGAFIILDGRKIFCVKLGENSYLRFLTLINNTRHSFKCRQIWNGIISTK